MVEATVSQSLKAHRQKRCLTIQKLADASGVSRAMISKIERGDAVPTTSVLGKLAEALDTSISQLIGGPVASSAVGGGCDLLLANEFFYHIVIT